MASSGSRKLSKYSFSVTVLSIVPSSFPTTNGIFSISTSQVSSLKFEVFLMSGMAVPSTFNVMSEMQGPQDEFFVRALSSHDTVAMLRPACDARLVAFELLGIATTS